MTFVTQLMLLFLIVCAIAVCLTRNLLTSVIIYMGYSMMNRLTWRLRRRRSARALQACCSS